jgi:hypothetical protein
MNTNRHLPLGIFLFAFALLTAQESLHAQTANTMRASTHLRSAVKRDDSSLAQRAVASLEQLKAVVLVYRSDGEFESDSKLARVPFETFTDKLNQTTAEVESILPQLSDVKLRSHLRNSLYSYRDGAFWWSKLDQRKVVTIASLRLGFAPTTPVDRFLASAVPYIVAIHWRQATKYLLRAQRLIVEANTSVAEPSR